MGLFSIFGRPEPEPDVEPEPEPIIETEIETTDAPNGDRKPGLIWARSEWIPIHTDSEEDFRAAIDAAVRPHRYGTKEKRQFPAAR